jgi:hypothetical protein
VGDVNDDSSETGSTETDDLHATVVGRIVTVHPEVPRPGQRTAYVDIGSDELLSFTSSSLTAPSAGAHVLVRPIPPEERLAESAWVSRCRRTSALCSRGTEVLTVPTTLPIGTIFRPEQRVRSKSTLRTPEAEQGTPMLVISPVPGWTP